MGTNCGNGSIQGHGRTRSALRVLGLFALTCATTACDRPHGMARTSLPSFGFGASDPTIQDATNAMRVIGPLLGITHAIFSAGTPRECQSGTMGGASIRACTVCVTILTIPHTGADGSAIAALHLERGSFNIAFKRAISVEQPDVAPANGDGVWVVALPPTAPGQPGSAPVLRNDFATDLTGETLASIGLSLQPLGYSPGFQVRPAGNALAFPLSDDAIIDAFATPTGKSLVQKTVGTCA